MSGNSRTKIGGVSHEKYTLNVDGSYISQEKKVGVGCIIRDNRGNLIVAASYNLSKEFSNYCDVAIAEAAALRNGLKLAKEFNIKLSVIRGDNQEVINHVVSGCNSSSKRSIKKHYLKGIRQPLSRILQQIIGLLDRTEKIELIYREANQVADKLASFGSSKLKEGCNKLFSNDDELPPQVVKLMNKDKLPGTAGEITTLVREELFKQISDMLNSHTQKTEIIYHTKANRVADKFVSSKSSNLQGGNKLATTHDANLPPQKKCDHKGCEVKFLEDNVCKKCDELQVKLTKKDKRIAELEVQFNIVTNQKLKLEEKERDLERSMDNMDKELWQLRDEKMKATKRDKYESIIVIMVGLLFYVIYFGV